MPVYVINIKSKIFPYLKQPTQFETSSFLTRSNLSEERYSSWKAELEEKTKDTPKSGTTKSLEYNEKNKKLKISREMNCPACKAVFPTKESMNLHTCTFILEGHISEKGKERQKISEVSQNLTKVEFKI